MPGTVIGVIKQILLGSAAALTGLAVMPTAAHAATPPSAPSITSVARGGDGVATINVAPAASGPATTSIKITASPSSKTCTAKLPATSCNIIGLTNGTTYTFTATATGSTGTSVASPASNTLLVGRRPFKPAKFLATAAVGGEATLNWTAGATGGLPLTGFKVTSATGAPGCTTDATATSCKITGLTPGTKYNWSLVAVNEAGSSDAALSNTITAIKAGRPDTPTVVSSERVGDGQVKVTVQTGKDNGAPITSVVVRVDGLRADGNFTRVPTRSCSMTPPATTCTIVGLTNGMTYRFVATASNATGTTPESAPAATIVAAWVPSRPQTVNVYAIGGGSLQTTWAVPATNGGMPVTGYTVTLDSGQTCTTTGLQCTIDGLTPGKKYTVTMTAANEVGKSPVTSAKTITVK
mgnify:FL=1